MNAASISRTDIITDDAGDSDSDASSDGIPDYYQPIASFDGDGDVDGDDNHPRSNGYHLAVDQLSNNSLSNGHHYPEQNEVREVDAEEVRECGVMEEEEEEEMRRRAESESAIRIAFQEDDSRRHAPLPSDNATRVMEAMRGISFSGFVPDWANHLDDDDPWVGQLQRLRLRHPPTSTS